MLQFLKCYNIEDIGQELTLFIVFKYVFEYYFSKILVTQEF